MKRNGIIRKGSRSVDGMVWDKVCDEVYSSFGSLALFLQNFPSIRLKYEFLICVFSTYLNISHKYTKFVKFSF